MKLSAGLRQARVLRKDYAASRWWDGKDAVPAIDNSVATFANGQFYFAMQPWCEPIPRQVHRQAPYDPVPLQQSPMTITDADGKTHETPDYTHLTCNHGRFFAGYSTLFGLVFAYWLFGKVTTIPLDTLNGVMFPTNQKQSWESEEQWKARTA